MYVVERHVPLSICAESKRAGLCQSAGEYQYNLPKDHTPGRYSPLVEIVSQSTDILIQFNTIVQSKIAVLFRFTFQTLL